MVDEDAENVTLLSPPRVEIEGRKRAACIDHPIGGSNPGHVFVTSEEDGRKSDVPGISVPRSLFGDSSVTLPSPSRA